jgi:hypothetical protein
MTEESPKTYKTLEALVEENLEAIKDGNGSRPYRVTPSEGKPVYAFTNSKGNAALAVCEVEACDQKEIKVAALNLCLKQSKEQDGK